eukprot:5136742-Prymnesium_polylepis.1
MCGCTDCIGIHSLQASLNGKRAQMLRRQRVQQGQRRGRAGAQAAARGWGAPDWHSKPSMALSEVMCKQDDAIPRWKCQTDECDDCPEYPIPPEERREDKGAEEISFHVYEQVTSMRKDGKPRVRLEL